MRLMAAILCVALFAAAWNAHAKLSPQAQSVYDQGVAALEGGKPAEAIPLFQQVLELSPEAAQAHHKLGAAYMGAGQFENALDPLREAHKLDPAQENAKDDLGMALALAARTSYFKTKDPDKGLAMLKEGFALPELGEKTFSALTGTASTLASQFADAGRTAQAEELLAILAEKRFSRKTRAFALAKQGEILYAREDYGQAKKKVDKALRLNSFQREARQLRKKMQQEGR